MNDVAERLHNSCAGQGATPPFGSPTGWCGLNACSPPCPSSQCRASACILSILPGQAAGASRRTGVRGQDMPLRAAPAGHRAEGRERARARLHKHNGSLIGDRAATSALHDGQRGARQQVEDLVRLGPPPEVGEQGRPPLAGRQTVGALVGARELAQGPLPGGLAPCRAAPAVVLVREQEARQGRVAPASVGAVGPHELGLEAVLRGVAARPQAAVPRGHVAALASTQVQAVAADQLPRQVRERPRLQLGDLAGALRQLRLPAAVHLDAVHRPVLVVDYLLHHHREGLAGGARLRNSTEDVNGTPTAVVGAPHRPLVETLRVGKMHTAIRVPPDDGILLAAT
mmetsp:Transcript_56491/g.175253  ORF Transcript_56491/g.175253 Transcript_56491/m.175253 type:complete len:342 (-) Transcript_56491:954-1979(-)